MTEYAERDIVALDEAGDFYFRHVSAMTAERLHAKSDIAAELAWRDAEIARLREALGATRAAAASDNYEGSVGKRLYACRKILSTVLEGRDDG